MSFPGAEGYGKYTTGGRGGEVYIVTNLNSSGAGSLKDALSKSGRTVVFEVSGTIVGRFKVPSNTTIAGQTAPGDGITIFGEMQHGSNVIVRYIRVRFDGNGDRDAFGTRYQENVMIDHVTASWSRDEVMSIYHGKNVTVQWSLISEACPNEGTDSHRFGGIWGNDYSTYHHNLIAHNENRTPRWASGAGYNDYRNNVTYNWGYGGSYGAERVQSGSDHIGSWINVIGNYYKPGPGSESKDRIASPSKRGAGDEGNWYVSDNFVEGSPEVTNDNWKGLKSSNYIKMTAPWDAMPINQETAEQAYQSVLADVGASKPKRDAIDERIISEVIDGTYSLGRNGFISCPGEAQLPELNSTPAPADSDRDGMPDSWEQANGLNPNDASDRNDKDDIGYTMLENYLNSIDSL
ncbi:pectate lyase [Alteromonadaceae bacterium Bs31]|nr:pectate lyase [Alteromonadaceae bacterium Bs31]